MLVKTKRQGKTEAIYSEQGLDLALRARLCADFWNCL